MNTTSTSNHVVTKALTAAISVIIAFILALGLMPMTAHAYTQTFKDTSEAHWSFEYVEQANALNYMNGNKQGRNKIFRPNDFITRAESIEALYKVAGKPSTKGMKKTPLKDVKSKDWFNASVTWAYNKKITTGYANKTFGVNDLLTREQFAAFLYREAVINGESVALTAAGKKAFNKMPDSKKVSAYAKTAMIWAMQNEIITGVDGKWILPQAFTTRSEVATMLVRAKHTHSYEKEVKEKVYKQVDTLAICHACGASFSFIKGEWGTTDPDKDLLSKHQRDTGHGPNYTKQIFDWVDSVVGHECKCGSIKRTL